MNGWQHRPALLTALAVPTVVALVNSMVWRHASPTQLAAATPPGRPTIVRSTEVAYNCTLTFNPGYGLWMDIDNDGVTIRSSSTGPSAPRPGPDGQGAPLPEAGAGSLPVDATPLVMNDYGARSDY